MMMVSLLIKVSINNSRTRTAVLLKEVGIGAGYTTIISKHWVMPWLIAMLQLKQILVKAWEECEKTGSSS